MTISMKLATVGVVFACAASTLHHVVPFWLWLTFLVISLSGSGVGIIAAQRQMKRAMMLAEMERVFGK